MQPSTTCKSVISKAVIAISFCLCTLNASAQTSHDITSLSQWGPYSKEYFGISHIADLQSGIQVEFMLIPGQYRRNFKIPNALFEAGVHPWDVTADMKHITYRHDIEWKDKVYVDATWHILDNKRVLLEAHCANNTDDPQNINLQLAVRKTGGSEEKWNPEIGFRKEDFTVEYPEVDMTYGIAWNYPMSEIRQFRCEKLEHLMHRKVHDHVFKNLKGDLKGHYTVNFLRPITLRPQQDTTILQMIACGSKEEVAGILEDFHKNGTDRTLAAEARSQITVRPLGEAVGRFALGQRLMQATMLTNVVYPINCLGSPIRHFCPGKNWNSLYTWDCGFIGWTMSEIDPYRGYEIIRQYTTTPEEEAHFIHHGTPLATQILAIGDVWKNNGCDEETLREIYPRLKRFYDYMTGPRFMKASGLLETWNIFYNSGGWDDYPPQWAIRPQKELRARTSPMVSTSYYIRCAKIMRLMAAHLKLKKDVKQYDAAISRMSKGILDNAWDEECGYFGYVIHDEDYKPVGLYRTDDGVNFNMGIDGVTPLVAGITTPEQQERLLSHIFTEGELWSSCGVTAVDQKAPYYSVDGYWNGTVWMPHQMILWKTMLDLGKPELARQIAMTALENWERECRNSYNCYEHFMIESGRGGGWSNFSGLSTPVINWYNAYFKPGTMSTGFSTLVSSMQWNVEHTELTATLEFDKDLVGKETGILFCVNPGMEYTATINGKKAGITQDNGLIEIFVKATARPMRLEILHSAQADRLSDGKGAGQTNVSGR